MDMFHELQVWRSAAPGVPTALPHDNPSLADPRAYDAAARALKLMALSGLMEIVSEQIEDIGGDERITDLVFRRLR